MTGQALVHWGGTPPWIYRGTAGSGTLGLSHSNYTVLDDLQRLVDAEIAEASDDENTVAMPMGIAPRNGDDEPYTNFGLGDAVQAPDIDGEPQKLRVVSIKVREDQYNNVQFGLELNSRLEDQVARQQRFIDGASPGKLSGRGDNVSSSNLGAGIDFGVLPKNELGQYNLNDYLVVDNGDPDPAANPGASPWWPLDENILLYRHPWILQQAGDTDTIIVVRYRHPDQTTIDEYGYTIKAGVAQPDDSDVDNASFYTNLPALKGGAIQVACTQAGDFAFGITWRSKYTSQT